MRATPTESTANTSANTAGQTSSWSLVIQFGMEFLLDWACSALETAGAIPNSSS